ncbi:classical arabinogalactan protein 4 [Stenotrophomonas sp. Iso1]|uniref:classical arabinogalactan protein 4 n=1 Tax=Stenotrophomonas sp. Iso1 TaxID=2977283 RepID=UPI0022B77CB1|nr:classical arabinogalactan protein 4 [Stenotrophomonas sp. Iso1]
MKRFTGWLLLATLSPALALAQLKLPPPPTATRPVQLPAPSPQKPKADDRNQAADNARLRERLENPALRTKPVNTPTPITPPATARPVYGSNGQPLNHLQQTSPNRVLDTRTGRYYDTVPSGAGQRVVPPPKSSKPAGSNE